MNLPRGIPRPAAWASAVLLFVYALAVSAGMAVVMPIVLALLRHSPRLGWLGMLALWLAPIAGVAAVHSAVDRAASRRAPERTATPLGGRAAAVTRGASGLERSIIWIVLAAYAYELEASVRGPGRQIP